ncbi:MAG: putative transcriptional regulator [halophilic archaeon J07HB67]|jgi:Predicted transcriptional regulators|nr:MAG: putative transcriptional regulator [halophilic archaeon J07HB67]
MSESAVSPHGGIETSTRPSTDVVVSGLELLSDDCAREILAVVAEEPTPARRISEQLDVSRTTVYRRLDRLEEAGLLDAQLAYDPDGHHRKEFALAVDQLAVTVDTDGVSVECTGGDAV